MSITCAALMCHAPIVVPAIAGSRAEDCVKTTQAMRAVASALVAHHPDVLVVVTPHAPRQRTAWGIVHDAEIAGSFERFGRADLSETFRGAPRAAQALEAAARALGLPVSVSDGIELDHGALVPLTFVREMGWSGPTLIVALPHPGTQTEDAFGHAITQAAESCHERWAVLASGDMSHRLIRGAPAGYHPRAKDFDSAFVSCLRNGDLRAAVSPDPVLQELAAEDVVQSTRVAAAAVRYESRGLDVLSYEGPFGVGYAEAVLYSDRGAVEPYGRVTSLRPARDDDTAPYLVLDRDPPEQLLQIARDAIEHALTGRNYQTPALAAPWDRARAVFVTLRSPDGTLRGCVGRTEPMLQSLAEEVADNAVAAALRDHRMANVELSELADLRIEVSVLGALEAIASSAQLDPQEYGLVVQQGSQRGVLLPNVEGVNTPQEQLRMAMSKGQVTSHAPYQLRRFHVRKVCSR